MAEFFNRIWKWVKRYKGVLAAVGTFLSGVAAFFTWAMPYYEPIKKYFWPDQITYHSPVPPMSYDPWQVLALQKISKEATIESLLARRDRLGEAIVAPIGIATSIPAWKRPSIYDFAYAVDYIPGQGDGPERRPKSKKKKNADEKIKTFFVSCVGRMDRAICQTSSEYRETNHIHYDDWLVMPISAK